ncbi:hypothetical protein C0995_016686 [Termitomyces sp. Mi166|nr:hypothetical protein C0995_016686 [Termitomyces sp. Mi166\
MSLPKRIIKETERLVADPAPGITAQPHDDNLRYFDVTIEGPGGSPFERLDRIFDRRNLQIGAVLAGGVPHGATESEVLDEDISSQHRYVDDLLRFEARAEDKWSPALQIRTVLLSIQALLSAPNPDDPLATDVAKHYKENEKDAQRVSREWTQKYANLD